MGWGRGSLCRRLQAFGGDLAGRRECDPSRVTAEARSLAVHGTAPRPLQTLLIPSVLCGGGGDGSGGALLRGPTGPRDSQHGHPSGQPLCSAVPGSPPRRCPIRICIFFNPSAGKLQMHTAPRVWSGLAIPRTRSEFVLQWLGGRCELHQPNS